MLECSELLPKLFASLAAASAMVANSTARLRVSVSSDRNELVSQGVIQIGAKLTVES